MSDDETKASDADDEATEDGEEEGKAKGKGLGLIPMVAAAVVVAGVAGGAAFVFAPTGGDATEHTEDGEHAEGDGEKDGHGDDKDHAKDDGHGDEKKDNKKKKKKADKGHGGDKESTVKPIGEVQHHDYATFLVLEPIIVSVNPIGRSKHLKVSLVFETDEEGAETMIDHGFYVQDVLNTYLRSVDATVLEDPSAMGRLRSQILRRIRAIVPDANVSNVLITEFILT